MKKTIKFIFSIFSIFILSACSQTTIHEDLQANDWNVVSSNGEAYTATFATNTVTFDLQITSLGFSYSINDEEEPAVFTMKQEDTQKNEPINFEVLKIDDEYIFTAQDEEVKEQYGNLTLSPITDTTEQ